jgi:hypothetical protein
VSPVLVKSVVDALVKYVVEAMIIVFFNQSGVVVDWLATPPYVLGVNGQMDAGDVGQVVRQMSPVKQIVVAVRLVVVAPALKSARPPKVETPVLLKLSDWIPPAKVDVDTFEMTSAFAVVVPAWKVPTTVDDACETKPFARVPRPMRLEVPFTESVPIVAVLLLMLVEVAPAAKVVRPLKVLVFARSVEDAAVMVNEPPAVMAVLFTVASVPERSDVPMVDEAITFPFWSTARSELERPPNQVVPSVASDVDAFWRLTTLEKVVEALKMLLPLKVLLLVRSVVEETVMEPPTLKAVPLMVPSEPVM